MENRMSGTGRLEIFTLGEFRILLDGARADSLRSRKAQALLVYLFCTAQRHSREELADLLWRDSPANRAMSNLRDVVHALRSQLAPFIDIDNYSLSPNREADSWVDAVALEEALALIQRQDGETRISTGDLETIENALAWYQDDFLEGFYLRGADGFEEWLVVERERIRLAVLDGCVALAKHHEEAGNHGKGIHFARKALALEPLQEAGHRALMRLLNLSGRNSEALLQYTTCRELLQKELEVEPSEETKELYERLLQEQRPNVLRKEEAKSNITLPTSKLIGREEELRQIKEVLLDAKCRLLTLSGVGGIGKSSLGLQAAAAVTDCFPDGAWLIELAPLNEEALLPDEIASVFGVSAQEARGRADAIDILIEYLKDKSLLLVLDNCEHLIESCAEIAEKLIRGCPGVKVLATSRETLRIQDETVFQVPPLALPPEETAPGEIGQYPAIQLFLERAGGIQDSITSNKENAGYIVEVCRTLEGIPLAIELAASRAKVLSLSQLTKRLRNSFSLLAGGARTGLPRHQALQATMDWSYGLLPEMERTLLRRLSIFLGGWTLEAAEEVAGFDELARQTVLENLSNLVDKSLVLVEERGDNVRYRMLEIVRQYGLQIVAEKEEVKETRQRHADYFLQYAEQCDEELRGPRQVEAVMMLEAEHDNLRGALRWALDSQQRTLAYWIVGALGWFWFMRGYWKESWHWFQLTEKSEGHYEPNARAKAICRSAGLQVIRGNLIGTVALVEEAVDIRKAAEDEEGLAWCLNLLGQAKTWVDSEFPEATPYLLESIQLFQDMGNDWGIAFGTRYMAQVHEYMGEYKECVEDLNKSIAMFEQIGDQWNTAHSLFLLGRAAIRNGDIPLAETSYNQCLEKCEVLADKVMLAHAIMGLGEIALQKGELELVEEFHLRALEELQKLGDENCSGSVLRDLGEAATQTGEFVKAAQFLKQSLLAYKKLANTRYMLSVINKYAGLAAAEGKNERAARLLGATRELGQLSGLSFPAPYRERREKLHASIQELMGKKKFEVIYKEGEAMSIEEATVYALEENEEASRH